MPNSHEPQLINTIGHSAGAIIFGIFLFLMLRDRAATKLRGSWLSFTAAGLAFLWNAGSLAVLFMTSAGSGNTEPVVFFCFAVLSFLPAVLLHISLDRTFALAVASGYGLSMIAVGMHLREIFHPERHYHEQALLLITIGFGILTLISITGVALKGDRQERAKASRIFGAMCSSLLAMSFVHFGSGHPSQAWSNELALHHAGIPLALFVLLQDYRFILLDAFIRFLANALLASILAYALIRTTFRLMVSAPQVYSQPLYETLLLFGFCLLLIAFALVRNQVQRWLTSVVFRRTDLNKMLDTVHSQAILFSNEEAFLGWATDQLGRFMSADRAIHVSEEVFGDVLGDSHLFFPVPASDLPSLRHSREFAWAEAIIPLRLAHAEVRYIVLGRRRGGRRYLSEDLQALSRLAAVILEQVEHIRKLEMHRLVSQAELRALQSQINPHFLFNALNTIYGIIPREASGARKTVLNLAEIFRYFLKSEKSFIPLSEELEIVTAYLDIERLRLGPRLNIEIDVDEAALPVLIPILSIQPLVENAVKHGISGKPGPGLLRLQAKLLEAELLIRVEDDGQGMEAEPANFSNSGAGIGLVNVRRRLQLCYGPSANLVIDSSADGTKICFGIPLPKAVHA